ncbi:MAG: phage head closure protein [Pseudomonadota bacterium]
MEPGELTERVRFQRIDETVGAGASVTETAVTLAEVWARVVPISGRERSQAQQIEDVAKYRVTIRRRRDVLGADRLLWRTSVEPEHWEPMAITFDGLNPTIDDFMTLDAERGRAVPGGDPNV